ncbi:MAG: hypothetical protein AB8H86_31360 [Polyangiales bacterium]
MSQDTKSPKAPKKRKWPKRLVAVALGLLAGVLITEAVFWFRDDGAFPHVNFYQADAELGVRLRPGATMRFSFQDNPVNDIQVNGEGYRGEEWPEGRENEILVVGDSQVFGLGVNDDETMAARLAELSGRPVINGGVPTYGPQEYTAVAGELMAERDIRTVVYVVNMSNDFFEDTRPNTQRHAVWDGWAVRAELAPETITSFPGRELLYRQSHAFYALRRLLNEGEAGPDAVTSEGRWEDLVTTSSEAASSRESAATDAARAADDLRLDRLRVVQASVAADNAVDARLREPMQAQYDWDDDYAEIRTLDVARGNPGDIVEEEDSEEGRSVAATSALIRRAIRRRNELIEARLEADPMLGRVLEAQNAVHAQRLRLRGLSPADSIRVPSTLETRLAEVHALCEENGAELLVVALPLDVLVSSEEWAKYEATPVDMEPTRVLLSDLVASAHHLGARSFDATDALRAAEPGAFLRGDLHMTAKGQNALAEAVAEVLDSPLPLRRPEPGFPEGRSVLPAAEEWVRTQEATVRGSSAARCETVRVREWLRVTCVPSGRNRPTGVTMLEGDEGEALTLVTADASDLIVPLRPGATVRADFHWTSRTQTLSVTWAEGAEEPEMAFGEARDAERPTRETNEATERLCACYQEVVHEYSCRNRRNSYGTFVDYEHDCYEPVCTHLFGEATDACIATHGEDCDALLRCVQGDRSASPACPEGHAIAGGTGHCFALCDDAHPCESGTCAPWQGTGICRP